MRRGNLSQRAQVINSSQSYSPVLLADQNKESLQYEFFGRPRALHIVSRRNVTFEMNAYLRTRHEMSGGILPTNLGSPFAWSGSRLANIWRTDTARSSMSFAF